MSARLHNSPLSSLRPQLFEQVPSRPPTRPPSSWSPCQAMVSLYMHVGQVAKLSGRLRNFFLRNSIFGPAINLVRFGLLSDTSYAGTARYHFPIISQRNITGYDNATSVKDLGFGPFGFEEAVQLQKNQVSKRLFFAFCFLFRTMSLPHLITGHHQVCVRAPVRPVHRQPEELPLRPLLLHLGEGLLRPGDLQPQPGPP